MTMPEHGRPIDDVIAELNAKRARDVRWQDGRTFGMVYDGGPSVHEVAARAAMLYLHENALNTKAFPSLGAIQADVVRWTLTVHIVLPLPQLIVPPVTTPVPVPPTLTWS